MADTEITEPIFPLLQYELRKNGWYTNHISQFFRLYDITTEEMAGAENQISQFFRLYDITTEEMADIENKKANFSVFMI